MKPAISQVYTPNLQGHLTAANVERFQNKLYERITRQNYNVFLIDMSEVVFLDSAGLITIVKAFKLIHKMGKRLVICSITPPVRIIFELVKLNEFIEIYQDYEKFEDSLIIATKVTPKIAYF